MLALANRSGSYGFSHPAIVPLGGALGNADPTVNYAGDVGRETVLLSPARP
jgi:hypothetical protein